MLCFRVIARLDIKSENLIKGYQMEGLRVLGKPTTFAQKYANEGADELLYLDTVASLYGRNQLANILEQTTEETFIPITVGGGIGSSSEVRRLLNAGADKVAINSAAIRKPEIVVELASRYGSQAIVVSIEAKRVNGHWEAYTDCGRQKSGKDAVEWAYEVERLGAGEILLTSVDQDGTQRGADLDLARQIKVGIPVVLAGGIGTPNQATQAAGVSDAIAIGTALHYGKTTIRQVKESLAQAGKTVR